MSPRKQVLHDIAARLSAGDRAGIEACFTADFRLHDPSSPDWPVGEPGAQRMIAAFAAMPELQLLVLDAIEEGDRVAVRWGASWAEAGQRREASIMAIYRFADDRIAEDWGVTVRAPWPDL